MRMSWNNCKKLKGEFTPPPDKSITHRALIIGAISKEGMRILNPLISGDTKSTINCLLKLGASIEKKNREIIIKGGLLKEPNKILFCGNSGTSARLLAGVLSGHDFFSIIDGDNSLKKRPMGRIVEPLRKMGAKICGREKDSYLPIGIKGGNLKGIDFELKIPSAQVKSSIILATLFAEGETIIKEVTKSRDHTERMLKWLGVEITEGDKYIKLKGPQRPVGGELIVPGDISSASFFICGAILTKGSHIVVKNVGLNPTRTGIIDIIKKMGGKIEILDSKSQSNEDIGDIEVIYSYLKGVDIGEEDIPSLIDELPLISLLATQAEGTTRIKGARELRFKESDRIKAISFALRKMGAKIEELEDGFIIEGPTPLMGGKVRSFGDHRIAMTLAIASLIAKGETIIEGFRWVNISFPSFLSTLKSICSL